MKTILKQIFTLSVLSLALSSQAIATPARKPYGLGLPISAGTGGATRSITNAAIIAIAPEDGGRTATSRPTFYWYLPSSNNFPYRAIFELVDPGNDTVVFRTEGGVPKAGLYKLEIPALDQPIQADRVYIWQLRLRGTNASSNLQSLGSIVLRNPSRELATNLSRSTTEMQRAELYSKNGYWFDALHTYTKLIEAEPNNQAALAARAEMMGEIFNSVTPESRAIAKELVQTINAISNSQKLTNKFSLKPASR